MLLTAGLATFTNGSDIVTFDPNALIQTAGAQVGWVIMRQGSTVPYYISSVDGEDQAHISANYAGTTESDVSYVIVNDYTTYLSLDRPATGEPNLPQRLALNFDKIDAASLASLLTAAGMIPHASAANTPAALALGLANLKLFVNAGRTDIEWAKGIAVGQTTRDTSTASGTQAITGVGFKPSQLILIMNINGTSQIAIGIDDGTGHYGIYSNYAVSAGTWGISTSKSLTLIQASGISYDGYVSSLDADGFTITWVKTGAKTGTANILYLALR